MNGRGEHVTHGDDVDEFLEWVLTLDEWGAAWQLLREKYDAGHFRFLGDVVILAGAYQPAVGRSTPPSLESVRDHARMLLAMSPTAAAATEFTRTAPVASDRALAADAAHIASQQPLHIAAQSFVGPPSGPEVSRFRELLAQELLLRNPAAGSDPVLSAWWESDRPADPLHWLPRVLADFEHDPILPQYSLGGSSNSIPFGPVCSPTHNVSSVEWAHRDLPWQPQSDDPSRHTRLLAPFDDFWKKEVRTVRFDAPLGSDDVVDALSSLHLEALAGVEPGPHLWCEEVPAHDVWEQMFAAAATGAAYGSGQGGGPGRLTAAQGMGALMNLPAATPFAHLADAARDHTWYRFDAVSEWFEQVAWDSGIACLSADRQHLAVVTASDTD